MPLSYSCLKFSNHSVINKLNCCNSHLRTIEGSTCLDEVMIGNEVERWAWFHNEQQRHFQAGCQQN